MSQYGAIHHRASDTFESVNPVLLTQGVATTAITTHAIADSADSFAPHLSSDKVGDLLVKAGMQKDYEFKKKVGGLP